jgi:hypothetical protein
MQRKEYIDKDAQSIMDGTRCTTQNASKANNTMQRMQRMLCKVYNTLHRVNSYRCLLQSCDFSLLKEYIYKIIDRIVNLQERGPPTAQAEIFISLPHSLSLFL